MPLACHLLWSGESPGVRPVARQAYAAGAQRERRSHLSASRTFNKREQPMRRILGKTLGGAMAVLCVVSTLAAATEMTCAKDDGKGQCIAATDPDGKMIVVVGDGLKAGEQMECED